jgi:hypothetical protein
VHSGTTQKEVSGEISRSDPTLETWRLPNDEKSITFFARHVSNQDTESWNSVVDGVDSRSR